MSMDYRKNKMLFKNLKYLIVENNQEEDDKVYSAVVAAMAINRTSFKALGFNEAEIVDKANGLMHVTLKKPRKDIEAQLLALKPGEELTDKQNTQITTTLIDQIVTPAIANVPGNSNNYKIGEKIQIIPSKEELQVVISFNIVKNNIDKTPV